MIKHIVLWRFTHEDPERDHAQLIQEATNRLESLPPVIPEIKEFEVGRNLKEGDFAADLALYSSFDDLDALQRYIEHPAHKEAAGFIGSVVTDRRVVDYEV